MTSFLRNILWWIGILTLQVVFILFFRPTMVYTPYIYLLLLFRIPSSFPRIGFLILAFCTGLFIDILANSWGTHTFSAVLIAFIQPAIVNLFSEQALSEEVNFAPQPMGGVRYAIAVFLLFLIYHLCTLFLWNFSFDILHTLFFRGLISSFIASFLVLLLLNLFKTTNKEENE